MSQVASTVSTNADNRAERELGARRWQQPTLEAFHLLTETLVWFVAIGVLASSAERTFVKDLTLRVEGLKGSEIGSQREAAERALVILEGSVDSILTGPSYLLFVLAALGGLLLVRTLGRARITGAFSGLVIVIASLLGLNLLLHLGLGGDLRFWDNSGLVRFIDQPGRYFSGSFDIEGFVANPTLGGVHGSALTVGALGLIACWMRFMYVGRSPVTIGAVLRSFTIGFAVMLVAIVFARLEGIGSITLAAIPYFVLGVMTMAAAQAARATFGVEGVRKTTPWVVSMAVTGVTLLAVGSLLGLLALLDARSVLQVVGDVLGQVIGVLLLIILTPIFWVVEPILRWLVPDGLANLFPEIVQDDQTLGDAEEIAEENEPLFGIPSWFRPLMQLLGIGLLFTIFFLLARRIVRRRDDEDGEFDEVHERMDGEGAGVGSLLRNLLGRGGAKRDEPAWLRSQAVYRLFARALYDTEERGLARLAGETPVEFAALATRSFDEPLFSQIAEEFDRGRYGRHFVEDDQLRPLADALVAWETANPPTEEMRNRLRGAAPLDEAQDFRFRLEMALWTSRHPGVSPDQTERFTRL
jgi:hypothetical protein